MKEQQFHYSMHMTFTSPVKEHHFTLRCIPQTDERQRISNLEIEVFPNEFISWTEDSFGNACIYGYSKGEHDHFDIDVRGIAETGLSDAISVGSMEKTAMYKYPSELTVPGEEIRKFDKQFAFSTDMSNYDKSYAIMQKLYQNFTYVSGVTNVSTTAEQALTLGQGVCQDYSHIMLSVCRLEHIPARYVVGMLEGEGQSHAWVEIYDSGRWIALDPTNNLVVGEDHIKISNGRDYKDCMINQGVFTGITEQVQQVHVSVEEQ